MAAGNLALVISADQGLAVADLLVRAVFATYLILKIASLELEQNIRRGVRSYLFWMILWLVGHETMALLTGPGSVAILVYTSLVTTAGSVYLALLSVQLYRQEQLIGALWLSIGMAAYSALFAYRVFSLLTGSAPIEQLGASMSGSMIALAIVLIPILEHFGYLAIQVQRGRLREFLAAFQASEEQALGLARERQFSFEREATAREIGLAIGHELRQPLNNIRLFIHRALISLGPSDGTASEARTHLSAADGQASFAADVTQDVISRFTSTSLEKGMVGVNEVLRSALDLMSLHLKEAAIKACLLGANDSLTIAVARVPMVQVIVNLVRNSIDALEDVDSRYLVIETFASDATVHISVTDTGTGISDEALLRVGQPFPSAKPHGLGLGLAISLKTIERYGGAMSFARIPSGGTQVTLNLPRAHEAPK